MRKLTICGSDLSSFQIIRRAGCPPAEQTAADFLQRVIEQSCGVRLPIAEEGDRGIRIGFRGSDERIRWDGFRISSDQNSVYLDGNCERGILYAAYEFAEKYLGYRMFAPDCERIVSSGEAEVPCGLDLIDNPAFEIRRMSYDPYYGQLEFMSRGRLNADMGARESIPYGGLDFNGIDCHTFWRYCPADRYYEEHPEYYALVDGKRIPCADGAGPGQLCLSNPDVLRIVTEGVREELRKAPGTKLLDLSQLDNENYCRCPKCKAVDEEEGSPSGSVIRFVNAVAEAIEPEFPDVMIQTFAYLYSRKPPKHAVPRKNVLLRYCTMSACMRHGIDDESCPTNGAEIGPDLKQWRACSARFSIWDYPNNYYCFIAPFPLLESIWRNLRFFADIGTIHVYEEANEGGGAGGAYPELKAYLLTKLLWNPYRSEEEYRALIKEFLETFYGPGWERFYQYLRLEHETTAHAEMTCTTEVDIAFLYYSCDPPIPGIRRFLHDNYEAGPFQPVLPNNPLQPLVDRIEEAEALMDEAYAMAETEEQRTRLRRSRLSLEYLDLFCRPRDRASIKGEELKTYMNRIRAFREQKRLFGMHYNWNTKNNGN